MGSKHSWPVLAWRRAQRGERQALHALVEAESADLAERQSLRWLWNESEYGGHYFGDVPDGGYRRLVEAMATGADLRLGVDVDEACPVGRDEWHRRLPFTALPAVLDRAAAALAQPLTRRTR